MELKSRISGFRRVVTWLLVVMMVFSIFPAPSAFAVTGSQLAADGTYSGTGSSVGTITVTVKNGKITNVTCSKATKSDYQALVTKWLNKISGQNATYDTINAISAATTSKKYGPGLKEGTLAALKTAPVAGGSGSVTNYTVTFNMNGHGTQIASQTVASGSTATKPANPTATGYVFGGWYSNSALTTAFDFNTAITKNTTIYAKWTENENAGEGGVAAGTVLDDGIYYCDTVQTENYDYFVSVTMTVSDGKIVSITAEAEGQSKKNAKRLKTAVEDIREQLLGKEATINTLSAIDSVSGATYSANTIRESLIIAANNGTDDSTGEASDTFNRVARDGTYKNSSATTYEEVYNPFVEVEVVGGVIRSMEAYAPGIRPTSAALLKEAAQYMESRIIGQPATQATIAAINVDAVSGATHSMKALIEELYAAFGGAPEEEFTETGTGTGYKIYNPPAEVSDNGLTLQKTLTRSADGTYTITITGYATKAASALGLYKQESKEVYTKADIDSGIYYYWYRGQAYQVHCDTYRNTDDNNRTYYYAYFTKNGTRMYMHQKGANTIMVDNDGVLKIGDSNSSKVYKAGQMPLYTKTTDYTAAGVYDSSNYTKVTSGKKLTYNLVESGGYYVLYNGNYYELEGKESSSKYYIRTAEKINGDRYYLNSDFQLVSGKSSAAYSSSKSGTILTTTASSPIYTGSGGSSEKVTVVAAYDGDANGLAITSDAVLIDEVNLNAFDVSGAKYAVYSRAASVSGGKVTVSPTSTTLKQIAKVPYTEARQSDGVYVRSSSLSYTGFDYSGNYVASGHSGRALVVEITGLTLAEGAAGRDLSSNIGNAEIYVTADSKYPEVAEVSPLFDVLYEYDGVSSATHTLTYDLNGGHPEEDYPESTELYAGTKVYVVDEAPEKTNAEFNGWASSPSVTMKTDENGSDYFIMPESDVTLTAKWLGGESSVTIKDITWDLAKPLSEQDIDYENFDICGPDGEDLDVYVPGADVYIRPAITFVRDGVTVQPNLDTYDVSVTPKDLTIAAGDEDDFYTMPTGKLGSTLVTMTFTDKNTGEKFTGTYTLTVVASETPATAGVYGDYSTRVTGASYINYDLIARVIVDENGKITDVLLDSENASTPNRKYLNAALETIRSAIVGKPATASTLDLISETAGREIDGATSATISRAAGKQALEEALKHLRQPYTVTWKFENGKANQVDSNVLYATRTSTIRPANPTKSSSGYTYTFTGWKPEVDFFVTDDATYTAQYTSVKNSYTITWQDENGKTIDTTTVPAGETPTYDGPAKEPDAQHTYTFDKWVDAEGNEPGPASGDKTYQPTYTTTLRAYTITWKNDDGTVINTTTVNYGGTPTHADPTKAATAEYTYTFAGWSPAISKVTGDATYTAKFNAVKNQYSVTFVDEDGKTVLKAAKKYDYGTKAAEIERPADPTKAATAQYTYTFAGWSPEIAPVSGNVVYTATYTETLRSYTITWKNDDGSTLDTTTVPAGETPTHDGPEKEPDAQYTYTFDKWVDAEGNEPGPASGDTSYRPTYTKTVNQYTVRFLNDDGSELSSAQYDYGTKAAEIVRPETPTKPNAAAGKTYTFASWNPAIADVTGDATYTAQYSDSDISYTITWVLGDGSEETTTVTHGVVPTHEPVEKTDPTNEYTYTFEKWTDADGNEPGPATGDTTYTAQFTSEKTGYKIIIEDYTKGKAAASLTDADLYYLGGTKKLSDRFYTTGQTYTFTVSAPMATVLAIHEDGRAEKILDEDGTYTRMYCTALEDGSYQFSVDVDGADVYLIMAYKGDLTLDGRVNTLDATQAAQIAARNRTASKLASLVADVAAPFNRVNTLDATQLAQVAARNKTLAWDVKK